MTTSSINNRNKIYSYYLPKNLPLHDQVSWSRRPSFFTFTGGTNSIEINPVMRHLYTFLFFDPVFEAFQGREFEVPNGTATLTNEVIVIREISVVPFDRFVETNAFYKPFGNEDVQVSIYRSHGYPGKLRTKLVEHPGSGRVILGTL